jgi:Cof subfamily protein (haloacid dehalogenase superfamily)
MLPIKLIATDLDGTLLDDAGMIPPRNKDALTEAIDRGVAVTLSTGRMFSSAMRFAAQIGVTIPMICYNGAMLRRPDGEILLHQPLDMDVARRLLATFRERNMYVQSYVDDVLYVRSAQSSEYEKYVRYFGVTGRPIGEELYDPRTAPTKLLAMTSGAQESRQLMAYIRETFGTNIYVTSSNVDMVEMMNPDVNKANSLRTLADSLGINMEQVMALGDGENDVDMIRAAGVGIAMGNGRESAKAAATEVAPTNDECGLAWAVEKYALHPERYGMN